MNKIRDYWFGILLALMIFVWLSFIVIVAVAPHDDYRMRGFAPCTYTLAERLSTMTEEKRMSSVISYIGAAYSCYASVMREGLVLWSEGKQPTPWANYLFYAEDPFLIPAEESEPLSEELLKANLLDEDDEPILFNDKQESEDENDK